MRKKVLIGLAVMLVATLAFVPAVSAEGPRDGTLTAHGDGVAALGGRGSVEISGRGILWFRDVAGDAEWTVSGHGESTWVSTGTSRPPAAASSSSSAGTTLTCGRRDEASSSCGVRANTSSDRATGTGAPMARC